MTSSTIKILLIGNYSIFRTALRMLIETEKQFKIVGETADPSQVSVLVAKENPGLILIDLPEQKEAEIFLFLENSPPDVPVLILSGCPDPRTYQKCLRSGVCGLVLKEKSAETLFKAIEKVHQGELWFERTMMGQIIQQLVQEKNSPAKNAQAEVVSTFTERERQILELICQGLKNKAIAERLFITETTVRHHLTSLFNKLNISTRLELVVYAFRHQLIKIPDPNGDAGIKLPASPAQVNGFGEDLKDKRKLSYAIS